MATKRRKRARRGRGEGGLYLADGVWHAVVELVPRRGKDGKIRRRRKVFKAPSQEGAIAKRDEWLRKNPGRAAATHSSEERLTFDVHLDRFFAEVVAGSVRPNTLRSYEGAAQHLRARLGALPLAKLSASILQSAFAEMREDGVGGRSQQIAHVVLRQALANAVKLRFLEHNFALDVETPKHVAEDIEFWNAEEMVTLLAAADAGRQERDEDGDLTTWSQTMERLGALFALSFDSGARQGEVFGLHWPEVDLRVGRIHVMQQLVEIKDRNAPVGEQHRVELAPVKTKRGVRWVSLAPQTIARLKHHRDAMMAAGRNVVTGPVFVDSEGGFLRKSNFLRNVHDVLIEKAGVKRCSPHAMRHTCATLLLAAGIQPHVVADRLGHEDVATTLRIYAHVLPRQQAGAAKAMADIMGGVADVG